MEALLVSTLLVALAEIGDKTQVATVVLAARFEETLLVIVGTTVGMLAANVPVVLAGGFAAEKLPLKLIRGIAALLFIGLGIYALLA
ncbi:TMEM165/GDT1 family protein [Alkalilimnicola ehrlichii]|uniref:TMEM165/GDT1 family protein n=1 Tax=Alkalilimnicola ehrlichii TaxID=351052 RepID=UPI0021635E43|nr:TMEM165/GDT1 family protein [Alkalilimnicola ehrlichii]